MMPEDVVMQFTYDRKEKLGEGSQGIVFKGIFRENNVRVAVKRIQLAHIGNNEREETALRQCAHPNVVKLFHVESDIDFKYYVLEFCVASLDHLFLGETNPKKYRGPMPATQKDVCLQLAKGMAHIHEQRLIHRDAKPGNVLIWVDSTGERVLMKWADFGFSKPVNERGSHSISAIRGTEKWYAPEIYRMRMEEGGVANPIRQRGSVKSDVFSEGLVFAYYLLSGNHPYGGPYDIPNNILNDTPVNLNEIEQQPMYNIIIQMLKNNHEERISSSQVVERISNI